MDYKVIFSKAGFVRYGKNLVRAEIPVYDVFVKYSEKKVKILSLAVVTKSPEFYQLGDKLVAILPYDLFFGISGAEGLMEILLSILQIRLSKEEKREMIEIIKDVIDYYLGSAVLNLKTSTGYGFDTYIISDLEGNVEKIRFRTPADEKIDLQKLKDYSRTELADKIYSLYVFKYPITWIYPGVVLVYKVLYAALYNFQKWFSRDFVIRV